MTNDEMLTNILAKIPLAHHMGLKVLECGRDKVEIAADFEKNRNHKMTAFGGSVATVLTLACWSWITNYLDEEQLEAFEVSIYKCEVTYSKPITANFRAVCLGPKDGLENFKKMLIKKSKARLTLEATASTPDQSPQAHFQAQFVAHKL